MATPPHPSDLAVAEQVVKECGHVECSENATHMTSASACAPCLAQALQQAEHRGSICAIAHLRMKADQWSTVKTSQGQARRRALNQAADELQVQMDYDSRKGTTEDSPRAPDDAHG